MKTYIVVVSDYTVEQVIESIIGHTGSKKI